MREVHAEDRVARLERGEVDGHVRLRARVRLHVGVVGPEELLRARRSRATRPRPRTRSRRSSACPGSPRRTCSSARVPRASSTASETKFSEAIISSWRPCRSVSLRIASATSGSVRARFSMGVTSVLCCRCRSRPRAARGGRPRRACRATRRGCAVALAVVERAAAEREHVRVVVLAREPGGRLVPRHRRPHAAVAVRGDGHADAGAAHDHSPAEAPGGHLLGEPVAEHRVVHRVERVRAEVLDGEAALLEVGLHLLLEREAGVVGGNDDRLGHGFRGFTRRGHALSRVYRAGLYPSPVRATRLVRSVWRPCASSCSVRTTRTARSP